MAREEPFTGQDHWSCIRCGLCIEACPTYVLSQDEGLSPRGRIHLIHALTGGPQPADAGAAPDTEPGLETRERAAAGPSWREFSRGARTLLDQCLFCRACEAVCPSGVRYSRLMAEVRAWLPVRRSRPGYGRARSWLRRVFTRPWLARLALGHVRLVVRLHLADLLVHSFTAPEHRAHYLVLLESLRVRPAEAREALPPVPGGRAPAGAGAAPGDKVLIFRGCITPIFYPAVLTALRSVLKKLGLEHETPPRQVCCGALHRQHGLLEEARALARKNIIAFEGTGEALILAESSGCACALQEYGDLLRDDAEFAERARAFSARVRDASCFLASLTAQAARSAGAAESGEAAARSAGGVHAAGRIQEPCHLRHGQRQAGCLDALCAALGPRGDQPPVLACGPAPEADLCCGGAGFYALLEPSLSAQLGERKADLLAAEGVRWVFTSDPGCRLQLQGRLARRGVAMLHAAELCDHCWQ